MRRKGSIHDLALLMVIFTFFVISGFLSALIYENLKTGIIASANPDANTTAILNRGTVVQSTFLNAIPFMIIGVGVAAIVAAFFIPSHPAMVPISIIMLSIYTVLSTIFSNVVWEFLNVAEIVPFANSYPLIVALTTKLPYVITVIGAIVIIVQGSKAGND